MCESFKVQTLRFQESRSDGWQEDRQVSPVSSSVSPEKALQTSWSSLQGVAAGQDPREQTSGEVNIGRETKEHKNTRENTRQNT